MLMTIEPTCVFVVMAVLSYLALPFPCVPSYFLLLRSFLPALQASLIYQYRCGQIRSHWTSSLYDQNTAGLKTR